MAKRETVAGKMCVHRNDGYCVKCDEAVQAKTAVKAKPPVAKPEPIAVDDDSPLLEVEVMALAEGEAIIERGIQTFVEVGEALSVIRDGRLYRATHKSFDAYCKDRWSFTGSYANKLALSAEIATVVSEKPGTMVPGSERQARALAPLRDEPEVMGEAWKEATADGKPTAAKVRESVNARLPDAIKPPLVEHEPERCLPESKLQAIAAGDADAILWLRDWLTR